MRRKSTLLKNIPPDFSFSPSCFHCLFGMNFLVFFDLRRPQVEQKPTCDCSGNDSGNSSGNSNGSGSGSISQNRRLAAAASRNFDKK